MVLVNDKLNPTTDLWHISPYNYCPEVRSGMRLPKKVQICDLTLREGRQIEGVSLRLDEVLLIAEKLVEAGVTMLQVHHDEPKEMIEIKKRFPHVQVEGLIHPTAALDPAMCRSAIDEIVDHGADMVDISIFFSDDQMPLYETMAGARISVDESIERAKNAAAYGKSKGTKVVLLINDVMRIPLELHKRVIREVTEAGVSIIRLDDTVAQGVYPAYRYLLGELTQAFPEVPFAFHVHNDIGMGAAALYAAMEGGAQILDASVNGLGERAGIGSLAEVAAVLQIWYGLDAGIDLSKMKELSELVADLTKFPVHIKKPCVGEQAFSDVVEVHHNYPPDGSWAYCQWKSEIFGNTKKVLLGHYSGPWSLRRKAEELGIRIPEEKLQAVLQRIRAEFRWRKRKLEDHEFRRIVEEA